jgi:integrase
MLEAIEQPRRKGEHCRLWERNRLGVILFLYSGLHLSEVASLIWADIELEASTFASTNGAKSSSTRSQIVLPLKPS